MTSSVRRRLLATMIVVAVALALTLWAGTWPDIYTFITDPGSSLLSRLAAAPVRLADDVMITMRSGDMVLRTGIPSYNELDLAQASTSYVMPYVSAVLALALPGNLAILSYAVLGLIAALASIGAIVYFARSTFNGVLIAVALTLTQANLHFALNGWDHLFQGVVFVMAIALAWASPSNGRLLTIGVLLAAGSLVRPDGALIALAILWIVFLRASDRRRVLLACVLPLVGVVVAFLLVNLVQFGHLTPTTTRLNSG